MNGIQKVNTTMHTMREVRHTHRTTDLGSDVLKGSRTDE